MSLAAAAGLALNSLGGKKAGTTKQPDLCDANLSLFFLSPVRERKQEQTLFKDLQDRQNFNFFKKLKAKLICELNGSIEMKLTSSLDPTPK